MIINQLSNNCVNIYLIIEPIDCQPKKNEPSTSSCVTVFETVAAFQNFCLYNVHMRTKAKLLTPDPCSCCILKTKEKTTLTILVHASQKSTSKMVRTLRMKIAKLCL